MVGKFVRERKTSCPEFRVPLSREMDQSAAETQQMEIPFKGKITYQNKVYHFNTLKNGTYYYKCADKNCKGRLNFK